MFSHWLGDAYRKRDLSADVAMNPKKATAEAGRVSYAPGSWRAEWPIFMVAMHTHWPNCKNSIGA